MDNPFKAAVSILPKGPTRYLRLALPFIHTAGEALEAAGGGGDNPDSAVYKAGLGVDYAGDVLDAITTGQPIPLPPAGLYSAQELQHVATQAQALEGGVKPAAADKPDEDE